MDYTIKLRDGTTLTLTDVSSYVTDGAGTRFYGAEDNMIASFYDGEVVATFPSSTVVTESIVEESAP